MGVRNYDHSLSGRDRNLIILLSRLEGLSQESVRSTLHRQGSFSHWWGLIFSEISRSSCSFRLETKVPRYPASAQSFWIDGYRIHARSAVDIPPFVSWILAAWTTADSKQPSTSTTMCRFLPFVFPSVNSRLLHVQLRIPIYNGAISSHCSSVKSLGYDFRSFSSIFPFYHAVVPLWRQVLTHEGCGLLSVVLSMVTQL